MKQGFASRAPTDEKGKREPLFSQQEVKDIKARCHQMFNSQQYLEHFEQWRRLRDTQLPFLGEFLNTEDETNKGRKRDRRVQDQEAWRANQVFAGGMASGLTPQSIEWFRFNFRDSNLNKNHGARVVIEERLDIMNRILAGTNFYNATHNNYLELAFGQSPLGIFEDPIKGVHYEHFPIGCYSYEVDHRGTPCSFAVKKKMSAYQLKEKFGLEKLPEQIQRNIKENKGYSTTYTLIWLVEKNRKANSGKIGSESLPYISYYWIDGDNLDKDFIRISGFHEFPIAVSRYQVIGNNPYGIGPAWYADSDNRMLFTMLREQFTNLEIHARPALQAPGTMDVDYRPGGITRYESSEGNRKIEPLIAVAPIFRDIYEIQQAQREYINRAYNVNLFAMLDQAAMDKQGRTAYELALRNQEKMQLLGPVVERQNSEYLSAIIERTHAILDRGGILPEFPDEVIEQFDGEEIKIEYMSPLAQAQKMSGIEKIEMSTSFIAQMAQYRPEVLDIPDWDKIVRQYCDKVGSGTILLRSEEDVAEARKQQAEAMQKEKEEAALMEGGGAARDYTQAAANMQQMANDGGNQPLEDLLNAVGGGVM